MPSIRSLLPQFNAFKFITLASVAALLGLAACGPGATPAGDSAVAPTRVNPPAAATLMPATLVPTPLPSFTAQSRATTAPVQGAPAVHLPAGATPSATDSPPTVTGVPATIQATAVVTPALAIPAVFNGDAGRGAVLFKSLPCTSCHVRVKQGRMIAPELTTIAADAEEIILRPDYHGRAKSAPAYIFESVVDPNAYVLPPYNLLTRDGTSLMPKDFAEQLTPAQLQDLVAYLMTLR